MTWIDDDMAELRRLQDSAAELAVRESQIRAVAEKIYNDLWKEVIERIAEAKSKGNHHATLLLTNGDPYERRIFDHRIVVPQPVKPPASSSDPKYVILTLTSDRLKIEIAGLQNSKDYLTLDLCDDGVVRPKHQGEYKQIDEAARLILRPLLFPEMFSAK
jgi:hypothetical protein